MKFFRFFQAREGRSFRVLEPMLWFGTIIGVFPLKRFPSSPVAQIQVLPLPAVSKNVNGTPTPLKKPKYRFVFCSFPTLIAVAWLVEAFVLNLLQTNVSYAVPGSLWSGLYAVLTFFYMASGLSTLCVTCRPRRLEKTIAGLSCLNDALPTTGLRTGAAVAMAFVSFFFTSFYMFLFIYIPSATGSSKLMTVAPSDSGVDIRPLLFIGSSQAFISYQFYMTFFWGATALLTEDLRAINKLFAKAVESRNPSTLREAWELFVKARALSSDIEGVVASLVAAQVGRLMVQEAISVSQILLGFTYFPNVAASVSMGMELLFTFLFPHYCAKEASKALDILQDRDEKTDDFKRTVLEIRSDMTSRPVVFSALEVFNLDLPSLWQIAQFLITIDVVIVQFGTGEPSLLVSETASPMPEAGF